MKRERDLARRLRSLEGLAATVSAMKSLSARHFKETRAAVDAAREYRERIERLRVFAPVTAPRDGPVGMIVIGSDLGLCGAYNARVAVLARAHRAKCGPGFTSCVGRRMRNALTRSAVGATPVDATHAAPASPSGMTDLLLRVAEEALTAFEEQRLAALDVVYSRFEGVGRAAPQVMRLLPIAPSTQQDPAPAPAPRYVARPALALAVVRELFYVGLYDALLDAMASEHGLRIVATQSAEDWLDERTTSARRHLVAARREGSTQEVIEIVAGARARGASVR